MIMMIIIITAILSKALILMIVMVIIIVSNNNGISDRIDNTDKNNNENCTDNYSTNINRKQ